MLQLQVHGLVQAHVQLVHALGFVLEFPARVPKPCGQVAELLVQPEQQTAGGLPQPELLFSQAAQPLVLIRRDFFRCGRGGGCPKVCHEIGNGNVHFVAHCTDGGNRASGNRPGDGFFVKAPEVLQRAAAPANDQHIRHAVVLGAIDGVYDVGRRSLPLNGSGVERDRNGRATPCQHGENVVNGCAGG